METDTTQLQKETTSKDPLTSALISGLMPAVSAQIGDAIAHVAEAALNPMLARLRVWALRKLVVGTLVGAGLTSAVLYIRETTSYVPDFMVPLWLGIALIATAVITLDG